MIKVRHWFSFSIIILIVLSPQFMLYAKASATLEWTTNGISITNLITNENYPKLITDNSGGVIVAWEDHRSGSIYDIYLQNVDSNGILKWGLNGKELTNASGDQRDPELIQSETGGAIITWQDERNGNVDIYAQRIDSNGNYLWNTDGNEISTMSDDQAIPQIVSDGSGGAIIAWKDFRSGTNYDIYAQHIDSAGNSLWAQNGTIISTAINNQDMIEMLSDGSGGALIFWDDKRSGNRDIYGQRITSDGFILWSPNGTSICVANNDQLNRQVTSDGNGGAILTWEDLRDGPYDVYAQRVDPYGVILWNGSGNPVSKATGEQRFPKISSDSLGGAYISWLDDRSSTANIYAQHLNQNGFISWTLNGKSISISNQSVYRPVQISDNDRGSIIAWPSLTGAWPEIDIFAQHLNTNGDSLWEENGMVITDANNSQQYIQMVMNAEDKVFIVWEDERNLNSDIYMQMISFPVPLGPIIPSELINILLILIIIGPIGVISIIGIIYLKKKKSKTVKAKVISPTD